MATMPLYDQRLATWRQMFNPLLSLTIQRYVHLQQQSQMGYMADLQWLYLFVERRDAVLKAVLERRVSMMKNLGHVIKIRAGFEKDSRAKKQQAFLEEMYSGIDNIPQAVEFMALASFRGYSHLEKHYSNDGDVIHLEPVPQYLWAHKLPSRDWLYNAKAFQTATGVPIDESNFIIRTIERPIDEIAAICFIRKGMSQKDWDGFVETYGIPPLFITLPQGIGTGMTPGQPGSEVLDYYQHMAEQVISDSRGVLPFGSQVTTPTKGAESNHPFLEHITRNNEDIVLAATSGLLTTLSMPTGMNDSQGSVHENAFIQLAKAEAKEIASLWQKQLSEPALNEEFPDQDVMAEFALEYVDSEDSDPIDDAKNLSSAGYQIDLEELSEETGYTLTLKQATGMGGGFGAGGNQPPKQQSYDGTDKYSDWAQEPGEESYYNNALKLKHTIEKMSHEQDGEKLSNAVSQLEKLLS